MVSNLSLDIENKGDCTFFRITDSSYYNPNLPVTCGHLNIKTPGCATPVEFEVEPYFSSVFNSVNLKLQTGTLNDCINYLPDGIYYIKYSINPNDKIYVEYNFLQNCAQYEKYITLVCKMYSEKCNYTTKEYNIKVAELENIKEMITSAKYLVEFCGNPEAGVCLYNEANELIKNFKTNVHCKDC